MDYGYKSGESALVPFSMVNPNNPRTSRRSTRTSTARAAVIQSQQAKGRRESRARAREVRKAKEREAENATSPEESVVIVEPQQEEGSWYFDLSDVLKWEEAPEIVLAEGPHLHVLYHEVLKQPASLVTAQLLLGNQYHFRFEETEAISYAESFIRTFQWQGRFFNQEQVSLVLETVKGIIRAWCKVDRVDLEVEAWHDKDRKLYRVQWITGELMHALNLKKQDMFVRLALLGQLVTTSTGRSTVSGIEEIPAIIEEVLGEFTSQM